ncbi:MAG: glycosyltransferase family 39 protein [Candidatus Sumerlaeota bacterium]|nr:glycosyltransferase family 39 protein [Candidatus Sumerlaeota bacterium]
MVNLRKTPSETALPTARQFLIAYVSLCAASWLGAVFFISHYVIDDTFIHLQFARNLAEGRGFRFWPGDPPVYGCTSPGWVALLAAGRLAGAHGVWFARLLSAGFGLAGVFFLYRITRRILPSRLGLLPPLLLAVNPWWVRWSASGMEATFAAWIALTAWLLIERANHSRRRALGLGALCGVGLLVRPELALLAPVAAFCLWLKPRQTAQSVDKSATQGAMRFYKTLPLILIPWLAIAAGWAIFARYHFGSAIPTAVSAKAVETSFAASLGHGLGRMMQQALLTDAPLILALCVCLMLMLFRKDIFLLRGEGETRRLWRFAVVWPLAVAGFILAGRGPMVSRYLLIAWPCLTLLGAQALFVFVSLVDSWLGRWSGLGGAKNWKRILILAATLNIPLWYKVASGFAVVYPHTRAVEKNIPVYRAVADYLRDKTPADAYIAAPEIGILGYYGERRLMDLGGLVTPEVNRRPTRGQQEALAVAPEFLRQMGVTHYLDAHGKVRAMLASDEAAQLCASGRFTPLMSWTFTGGTSLTDRKTYTVELYSIEWK